jgi:L-rhamnose-H+ transport protein
MALQQWLGLLLTMVGGLLAGTSAWPTKMMRTLRYEHWALIASLLGLLILPWTVALWLCPHALAGYATLPAGVWLKALVFSTAWGVANVLCMLAWEHIGVGLTLGLLTGIGLPVGVLVPMLCKGSGLFATAPGLQTPAGHIILLAVGIMLVGVLLAALAGHGRQGSTPQSSGSFRLGLVMACLAGLLQVGLSFSFVYTQGPIVAAMKQRGAEEVGANLAVWAVCLIGGGVVNVAYPLFRLFRDHNWRDFGVGRGELGLAVVMGITFLAFIVLMGSGLRLLGPLGASVGFGVYQALQLTGAQALGLATGEWRQAHGRCRRQMRAAVALLLVAVVIIAYAGSLPPASRAPDRSAALDSRPHPTSVTGHAPPALLE